MKRSRFDYFLTMISMAGLVAVYLFQDFLFFDSWNLSEDEKFILQKVLQVVLNGLCMLLILVSWFHDSKITRMAIGVLLIDAVLLLPLYLYIKIHVTDTESFSVSLLSLVHRLIVNPTLMLLIIPAAYFQKFSLR
jgi:exosortase F-associated protein